MNASQIANSASQLGRLNVSSLTGPRSHDHRYISGALIKAPNKRLVLAYIMGSLPKQDMI